jgi:hypothetical protein
VGRNYGGTGRTCSNTRVVSYIYLTYPSNMIGKSADLKHVKYGKLDLAIRSEFKKCPMSGVGPSFTVVLTFKNKYFACYYL